MPPTEIGMILSKVDRFAEIIVLRVMKFACNVLLIISITDFSVYECMKAQPLRA